MKLPTPFHQEAGITIYRGDCRKILPLLEEVDCVIADPPYGETSLDWDLPVSDWLPKVNVKPSGSLWCFGSLRAFLSSAADWKDWQFAQDVIWEKHNGSGFHADRFKRVHELAAHFYRGRWKDVYKSVVKTNDAVKKTARRKYRPTHMGQIERGAFLSIDGGPRIMRSVIKIRSCHGYAEHPTQKPVGILGPLIEFSCPPGGTILDPFMGSGSVLRAAKDLGRRAIGIEKYRNFCEVAKRRMAQGVLL